MVHGEERGAGAQNPAELPGNGSLIVDAAHHQRHEGGVEHSIAKWQRLGPRHHSGSLSSALLPTIPERTLIRLHCHQSDPLRDMPGVAPGPGPDFERHTPESGRRRTSPAPHAEEVDRSEERVEAGWAAPPGHGRRDASPGFDATEEDEGVLGPRAGCYQPRAVAAPADDDRRLRPCGGLGQRDRQREMGRPVVRLPTALPGRAHVDEPRRPSRAEPGEEILSRQLPHAPRPAELGHDPSPPTQHARAPASRASTVSRRRTGPGVHPIAGAGEIERPRSRGRLSRLRAHALTPAEPSCASTCSSRKRPIASAGAAPMKPVTTSPSRNTATVGMERIP